MGSVNKTTSSNIKNTNKILTPLEEQEKALLNRIANNPKEILLLIRKLFGLLESNVDRMGQIAKTHHSLSTPTEPRVPKITTIAGSTDFTKDNSILASEDRKTLKQNENIEKEPVSRLDKEISLDNKIQESSSNSSSIEKFSPPKNIQKPIKEALDEEDLV